MVFVIDHAVSPAERFSFEIPDAGRFTRAVAASGKPVELKSGAGGALTISLPLDTADAIVLLKPGG